MPGRKNKNKVPVISVNQTNPINGNRRISLKNSVHYVSPELFTPAKPRRIPERVASGMSAVGGGLLYTKNPYLMGVGYMLQLPDISNDYDNLIENPNAVTITDNIANVGGLIPQVIGKGDDIARGLEIAYDAYSAITGESPASTINKTVKKKKRRHLDEVKPLNKNVERKLESQFGKDN